MRPTVEFPPPAAASSAGRPSAPVYGALLAVILGGGVINSPAAVAAKKAAAAKKSEVPTEILPGGAPSLTDTVGYLTRSVSQFPSKVRPCKAASTLEISPEGAVKLTTLRQTYCEDSLVVVHLQDLDASTVRTVWTPAPALIVGCKAGATCATVSVRRKSLTPAGWILRDTDWVPGVLETMPARQAQLEIALDADAHTQERLANGLRYLITTAAAAPEFQLPADPFVTAPVAASEEVAPAEPGVAAP